MNSIPAPPRIAVVTGASRGLGLQAYRFQIS